MSGPGLVALVVLLLTLGVLAVMALALIRHLKLLAASVRLFGEAIRPDMDEIERGLARAADQVEALSGSRSNQTSGAMLRR